MKNKINSKKISYLFFLIVLLFFEFAFSINPTKAAPCATGGSQTINVSCEIDGSAAYTNLTITGGAIVTSTLGQKMIITASGKVQIDAGSGIDVSGKGNNAAGQGTDGTNVGGTALCNGTYAGGGGGGGYGAAGTDGTNDCCGSSAGVGGPAYGSNINPGDLGSPGGLGGGNASGNGMGGGAVKISASNIVINGFIRANGTNGSDPIGKDGTGGGGGGSGGSIWLVAGNSLDFTGGTLEAKGGNGGADVNCGGSDGPGGPGSGGRISLQSKGMLIDSGTHSEAGGTFSGVGLAGSFYENLAACTLFTESTGVFSGDTATLSWTITSAATATISGIGTLTPAEMSLGSGTKITPPIVGNVTYTMTVTGPGGPATCGPINIGILVPPTGGLVPCARIVDNPATGDIDESKPCNVCAMFYMLKNIINFVLSLAVNFGVFIIIMSGLLYALSAGNPRRIEMAKTAMNKTIAGIIIIFIAWLVIAVILQAFGFANVSVWNQVNCIT